MGRLIDKVALIASRRTPLFLSATRLLEKGGEALSKEIWGATAYGTALAWLKRAGPTGPYSEPEPSSIAALCDNYNAFLALHRNDLTLKESGDFPPKRARKTRVAAKFLQPRDFDETQNRFSFAFKLGFTPRKWEDAQNAIDEVLVRNSILCKEQSVTPTAATAIYNSFQSVAYLYLKSLTELDNAPVLVRGTLRVKKQVQLTNSIYYVPCKLVIPLPSIERPNRQVAYSGSVSLKGERLFFSLSDEDQELNDMANFMIDRRGQLLSDAYSGLWSSVSSSKELYASPLIYERRAVRRDSPKDTIEFMRTEPRVFPKGASDIPKSEISPDLRAILVRTFVSEVFRPFPKTPALKSPIGNSGARP